MRDVVDTHLKLDWWVIVHEIRRADCITIIVLKVSII